MNNCLKRVLERERTSCVMPADTLSNDDLTRLYTWVDEIELSRPKRNIARDFSDGVLVAEVRDHEYGYVN